MLLRLLRVITIELLLSVYNIHTQKIVSHGSF